MRNFLSEMLYALTSAYSRKDYDNRQQGLPLETNIGKLFSILAWGLDSVEEQTEMIMLWENIENARGAVLDRYGANFGVKRVSSDDRFYRLAIQVKIMSQLSGGDADTVIRAAGTLLDVELSDVLLEDVFPAKISLYVDKKLLSPDRVELIEPIAYTIKRILAAGVGMRLYLRTYRTYYLPTNVGRGGAVGTFSKSIPIGRDRMGVHDWNVSRGAMAQPEVTSLPVGQDRTSRVAVQTAQGAVQRPTIVSTPLDAKVSHRGRQDGAGGVIYHAHITSKRVD